mmetsp:Transcript_24987/g.69706  ORF Transcript_24987/g.69706 Transcript_24987/m.69706 type:complete len:818 (+) Transcript_24987:118-2571(+)
MRISASMLLAARFHPQDSRDLRSLLTACDLAYMVDKTNVIMSQLNAAVADMTSRAFWPYELLGHTDTIREVMFSPDGTFLASVSDDTTTRVWPIRSTSTSLMPAVVQPAVLVCNPNKAVVSLSWSPLGTMLAVGSEACAEVCIWKLLDREANEWELHQQRVVLPDGVLPVGFESVRALEFSPDGSALAVAVRDGSLQFFPVTAHPSPLLLPAKVFIPRDGMDPQDMRAVAWVAGGRFLLAGGTDKVLRVWDTATLQQVAPILIDGVEARNLTLHRDLTDIETFPRSPSVTEVALSMDERLVMVFNLTVPPAGADGEHLLRIDGVQWLLNNPLNETASANVYGVAWSPDGRQLACSVQAFETIIFDRVVGSQDVTYPISKVLTYSEANPRKVHWAERMAAQRPIRTLATASEGTSIQMWQQSVDFQDGGPERTRLWCSLADREGVEHSTRSSGFSSDGTKVASGAYRGSVCVWRRDPVTRQWNNTELLLADFVPKGPEPAVRIISWSPDSRLMLVGSDDWTPSVWDTSTVPSKKLFVLANHTDMVRAAGWSTDSRFVATGGWLGDMSVIIWDVSAGDEPFSLRLTGHTEKIQWIAWSGNFEAGLGTTQLASASGNGELYLWTLRLASGGSAVTLAKSQKVEFLTRLSVVQFSSTELLAVGDSAGSIHILQREPGGLWSLKEALQHHTQGVRSLGWSPDGRTLATCGRDSTIAYSSLHIENATILCSWKVATPACDWMVWMPEKGEGSIDRVAFSRTPSDVAPASIDPNLPLFTIEIEHVVVGFRALYGLLRQMTYSTLNHADLETMGYGELKHLVAHY